MFLSQTFPESRPTQGISRAVKKIITKKKGGFLGERDGNTLYLPHKLFSKQ